MAVITLTLNGIFGIACKMKYVLVTSEGPEDPMRNHRGIILLAADALVAAALRKKHSYYLNYFQDLT